jgi:ribosome modulation factor
MNLVVPSNVLLPKAYWEIAKRQPVNGQYTPNSPITTLKPNEVFIFGSNAGGFHGAGSAGWAYTGMTGNQYRAGNSLLKMPKGTKGKWAVLGQATGYQEGTTGRSYAICTIINPGAKRSMSLQGIRSQVEQLYQFATAHPELTFLVPQSGEPGKPSLNGYTLEENASCYL